MLQEIEIGKLVPNDYNPPNRATRNIDSLSSSLKGDGQISTITVRPLDGKFEIVDGTRRFESAKKAGLKKMLCNVLELSRDEAMDYNYIANKETEPDSAMDEAWRFFERLGLSEESIYTPSTAEAVQPLPGKQNQRVQDLASRLGISPNLIEIRLPLMALPPKIVQLLDGGDMIISSAQEIARLRLLEDKKWAHKEMAAAWKKCGDRPADLKFSIDATLKDYRDMKEMANKNLEKFEEKAIERFSNLRMAFGNVKDLLTGFRDGLPDELRENFKDAFATWEETNLPDDYKEVGDDWDWPKTLFQEADKISAKLHQDNTYREHVSKLQGNQNDMEINRGYVAEHEHCRYCQTEITVDRMDVIIKGIIEDINGLKAKDGARVEALRINQRLSDALRDEWNYYSAARKSLDKAIEAKKEAMRIAAEKTKGDGS